MNRTQTILLIVLLIFFAITSSVHAQDCPYKRYGDANCDSTLSSVDEVQWKNEYLKTFSTMTADFNADGKISLIDLEIFLRSLINGLPNLTQAPTANPSTVANSPTAAVTVTGTVTTQPTSPPPIGLTLTATPVPSNATYPAQILNLTNWKMTVPVGNSEDPTEIHQPELATYKLDPWFVVQGNGVRFRAPVNAVTTGGSTYPRSELREMINNGDDNAKWASNVGVHTMTIDQAITHVPLKKKHVVAGQIHDLKDDVIVIRLEYPKLFIDINGADGPTLDANYTLGKRFTVTFKVSNDKTSIYYNGSTDPAYTLDKHYTDSYFKAGAYTQSRCGGDSPTEDVCTDSNYGEVMIYGLTVTHQ